MLAHGRLVEAGRVAGCVFLAFVSVAAALGFLVYGGRLFLMLQRFPIESRGRTKKLREVRLATETLRSPLNSTVHLSPLWSGQLRRVDALLLAFYIAARGLPM